MNKEKRRRGRCVSKPKHLFFLAFNFFLTLLLPPRCTKCSTSGAWSRPPQTSGWSTFGASGASKYPQVRAIIWYHLFNHIILKFDLFNLQFCGRRPCRGFQLELHPVGRHVGQLLPKSARQLYQDSTTKVIKVSNSVSVNIPVPVPSSISLPTFTSYPYLPTCSFTCTCTFTSYLSTGANTSLAWCCNRLASLGNMWANNLWKKTRKEKQN